MHVPDRWSLSPAYDLNPVPEIDHARMPKTAISEEAEEPSIAGALAVAPRFALKPTEAQAILAEVFAAVKQWRKIGVKLRIKAGTLDAYVSAFEHPLMDEANRLLAGRGIGHLIRYAPPPPRSKRPWRGRSHWDKLCGMAFEDFSCTAAQLRARYRHLVWSNPDGASDDVYIGAALRRTSFLELADFYGVFGLPRLRRTWQAWQQEEPEAVRAVHDELERIFKNLQSAGHPCL